MKRLGTFVIAAALIAATISCTVEVETDIPSPVQHRLAISSTPGGSVTTPGEGIFEYEEGAVAIITATPASGHRFDRWTGDVTAVFHVNMATTTVTMTRDCSIVASFVAQCGLTADSTEGGEVIIPGEGTFTYDAGTTVDLVAEAEEGYKFLHWTGDTDTVLDVTASSTKITVGDDCAITANFIPEHIYLDRIGPGLWGLGTGDQGIDAVVTEEGIAINVASDPVDNPEAEPDPSFGAGAYCTYLLKGDFDVRVDYELITWRPGSGVRVGLSVGIPGVPRRFMNVERVGWGSPEWPHLTFREVYLVNFEDQIRGITSTDDRSGTLRICREGEILIGYYRTPEGWYELHRAEWSMEDVYVWIGVWSHEYLFGGEEISVLLRAVEIVQSAA